MDRPTRMPYFERGYEEDRDRDQEFNSHPLLPATIKEFSRVSQQMVDLVAERVAACCLKGLQPRH